MWHKRLLASDSEQGFKQWYWSNPDTGEVALQSEWEVGHIAETAKGIYNTFDERAGWKGDLHHVGWIPQQVLEHEYVHHKRTLKDRAFWRHWLNQRENRAFRTRPGVI